MIFSKCDRAAPLRDREQKVKILTMQCPECKSTHIHKNGKKKGKQNYRCVHYLKFWDVPVPYTDRYSHRKRSHFF